MFLVIIAGIFLAVLLLAYVLPMCLMHPLASGEIEEGSIIAIRNRINNLFFIPADGEWIVVDAGSDAKMVKQEMERMSIEGSKVKGVFLTHTDYDHVDSVTLFPNAVIYMSEQEKQMIDGGTFRQFFKKNRLPKLSEFNKIVYLQDSETVELCKHKVRIIWTPGHTKGSAIYAVDGKYLFTGDAFKAVGNRLLVHPYTMDRKKAKETILAIRDELEKYDRVFTAHYGIRRPL